jgi:hypothetical protein
MAERQHKNDWESVALRRVASRVESVTASRAASGWPAADAETDTDTVADEGFGWEESVLRRLRSRLFGDDSLG